MARELRPWQTLKNHEVFAAPPWISVFRQEVLLPNGNVVDDYHQIRLPEFSVVYAQTADGLVIVERQYKHGHARVSLTLPAGTINPGEEPMEAAKRELLEETGFRCNTWDSLGSFAVHGNYGCGAAHMFLAREAYQVKEPDSGDLEDMEILLMEKKELADALLDGRVGILGTVATVALAQLKLSED